MAALQSPRTRSAQASQNLVEAALVIFSYTVADLDPRLPPAIEAAISHDAHAVGPAAAHEAVDLLVARGVAGAQAYEKARVEAIVDAGRGATEIVSEGRRVAIAGDIGKTAHSARPSRPRACRIAVRNLAGLGQRLTLAPAADVSAGQGHLLADRVHKQHPDRKSVV